MPPKTDGPVRSSPVPMARLPGQIIHLPLNLVYNPMFHILVALCLHISMIPVPVSRSPAPSHSTASSGATSGSSRTDSPVIEEVVTMATLGLKIGDRIVIDGSRSKPKVDFSLFSFTSSQHFLVTFLSASVW